MASDSAVLFLASACGNNLVTEKDLASTPEAHLYYPGSKVISTGGADERSTITGDYPAEVRSVLQSAASADELYSCGIWVIYMAEVIYGAGDPHFDYRKVAGF